MANPQMTPSELKEFRILKEQIRELFIDNKVVNAYADRVVLEQMWHLWTVGQCVMNEHTKEELKSQYKLVVLFTLFQSVTLLGD